MDVPTPPSARAEHPASSGERLPSSPRLSNPSLLILAFLGAAALALFWRQDANWDLLNYHYYNAWAFLTGRVGFDIAPAQLQTFHNPLLDVPMYLMAAADWPPRVIAIVLSLPTAAGVFFLARIVLLLFRDVPDRWRGATITAALAIGLTGVNGITLNASTMNEWPGAAFTLCALWLLLRHIGYGSPSTRALALAGFLMGLASGLKLTAATGAVGLAAAILAGGRPRRVVVDVLWFGLPVLAGIALASGFWMALLEAHFGNPLFPYFNQWFQSPLLPPEPVLPRAYGPHTLIDWLKFPFDLGFRTRGFVTEALHRDFRFPVLYLFALVAALAALAARLRGHAGLLAIAPDPLVHAQWRFVGVFFAVSFVVWTALHSVYRYLLPLELLSGALIVRLLWIVMPRRGAAVAIIVVGIALIAATRYPNWGRVDFGEHFLEVQAPRIEPHALIVVAGDEPMAYVLPAFPADARHVGIDNNLVRAWVASGLRDQAIKLIATHDGPRYALVFPGTERAPLLDAYGIRLVPGSCAPVRTNLTRDALALCRIERTDGVR